jgi:hypothetical protein
MAMTPVIADNDISFFQPVKDTDSVGFLTNVCMRSAIKQSMRKELENLLLEVSYS